MKVITLSEVASRIRQRRQGRRYLGEFINECTIEDAITLDKVKKAKEEIENINPVYSTISDRIPVLKNCDDIKAEVLEILDKLIAESEEK